MIEFSKINVEGFCNIRELDLQLNTNKITIIRGSNGNGKTSIFSAIVWALYGKNIKGISDVNTWEKYRPKAYQGTKVELYFTKDQTTYKIVRCQKYKGEVAGTRGKDGLWFYVDAIPVENKNKNQIQKEIEKTLEMSYGLFLNSIMFGQGLKRLIQETNSDKKKIFEEIFELQYLSKAKELAYQKYSSLSEEKNSLSSNIRTIEGSYSDLENLSSTIEEENKRYAEKMKKRLTELENEKAISANTLNKNRDCQGTLEKINQKIKEVEAQISSKKKQLQTSKEKTSVGVKELLEQLLKLLEKGEIKEAITFLKDLKEEFVNLVEFTQQISDFGDKHRNLLLERREVEKKVMNYDYLKLRIKQIDKEIESLKSFKPKKKPENVEEKLESYKKKLDALKKKSQEVTNECTLYKWAYDGPLSNNGIKAFLFESSLGFLNETLRSYSDILGFDIQFTVDLNSTKKDFDVLISKDGIEVIYEELSGGEKQLVNLSMAFAMNALVNKSKGVNIAFLDEVFESLSQDNIEIVVNLIRQVYAGRSLFLITHQDSLPVSNSKTITVSKKQGLADYTL